MRTGIVLAVLVALFGLQSGSAERDCDVTNRSVFKQADIQAVVPRLEEGKTAARKAPDLARVHLFCPGADGIGASRNGQFSKVVPEDIAGSAMLRLASVQGRAPPAPRHA
jgi:hypothetical protein